MDQLQNDTTYSGASQSKRTSLTNVNDEEILTQRIQDDNDSIPQSNEINQLHTQSSGGLADRSVTSSDAVDTDDSDERKRAATLDYFIRYENMVRSQDSEDEDTIAHLRPIFIKIQQLGRSFVEDLPPPEQQQGSDGVGLFRDTSFTADHDDTFQDQSRINQSGLSTPQHGGNLSSPNTAPSTSSTTSQTSPTYKENSTWDPQEILTFAAIKKFLDTLKSLDIKNNKDSTLAPPSNPDSSLTYADYHFIQTDEQLMMILETFEEAAQVPQRIPRRKNDPVDEDSTAMGGSDYGTDGISFAEFVHAYKSVISGMQALQMLPTLPEKNETSHSGDGDGGGSPIKMSERFVELLARQRERTRERTLNMVRAFSSGSTAIAAPSTTFALIRAGSSDMEDSTGSFITEEGEDEGSEINRTDNDSASQAKGVTKTRAVQGPSTPIQELRQSMKSKQSEVQALLQKQRSGGDITQPKKTFTLGILTLIGLMLIGSFVGGLATYYLVSCRQSPPPPPPEVEVVTVEKAEPEEQKRLKISLKNAKESLKYSEDKMKLATTRITKMTSEIDELQNEVIKTEKELSKCNEEKPNLFKGGDLLSRCTNDLISCTERNSWLQLKLTEQSNSKKSEGADDSVLSELSMEELAQIEIRQNKALQAIVFKRQIYSALGVGLAIVGQRILGFFHPHLLKGVIGGVSRIFLR